MTEKIQNKATKKLNIAFKNVNPKISLASKKAKYHSIQTNNDRNYFEDIKKEAAAGTSSA